MSLINQMLQDLERRRESGPRADQLHGVHTLTPTGRPWRLRAAAGVLGICLASAAAYAVTRPTPPAAVAVTLPQFEPVAVAEPIESATSATSATSARSAEFIERIEPVEGVESSMAPAVRLQMLRLEREGATTRLILQLDGPFEYDFHHDRDAGLLVLRLPDAGLGGTPDAIPLAGTPIRALQTDDRHGGVALRLELREAVLTRVHGRRDGPAPQLVLDLTPEPRDTTAATPQAPDGGTAPRQPSLKNPAAAQPEDRPLAGAIPATPTTSVEADVTPAAVHIRVTPRVDRANASPADVLAAAEELAAQGKTARAAARLQALLEREPNVREARLRAARLLLHDGRAGEAEALLEAGRVLDPGDVPIARHLAELRVRRGDLTGAAQVLAQALERTPGDGEAHGFLAGVQARLGEHPQAAQHYRLALKHQSDHGMWWLGLAISLEGQQDWSGALSAYRRAGSGHGMGNESRRFAHSRIAALAPHAGAAAATP